MNLETTLCGDGLSDDVYYRLFKSHSSEKITVITVQWFDELDYNHSRYVKNSDGYPYYFLTEEDAIKQMRLWFKDSEIDEEYRQGDINLIR